MDAWKDDISFPFGIRLIVRCKNVNFREDKFSKSDLEGATRSPMGGLELNQGPRGPEP